MIKTPKWGGYQDLVNLKVDVDSNLGLILKLLSRRLEPGELF